jgi:predicted nucleic acid-binding protein
LQAFARWQVCSPLAGDAIDAARHQLSYWNSMIGTSAVRLGCEVL